MATLAPNAIRGEIVRLAHRGMDLPEFASSAARVLRRAVPFDGVAIVALDPATALPVAKWAEQLPDRQRGPAPGRHRAPRARRGCGRRPADGSSCADRWSSTEPVTAPRRRRGRAHPGAGHADRRRVRPHRTRAARDGARRAGPVHGRDRRPPSPVGLHRPGPPEVRFEKLGVSSRGELVARLFVDHYLAGGCLDRPPPAFVTRPTAPRSDAPGTSSERRKARIAARTRRPCPSASRSTTASTLHRPPGTCRAGPAADRRRGGG